MLKLDYSSQLGKIIYNTYTWGFRRNFTAKILLLTLPAYVICSRVCPAQSCRRHSNESPYHKHINMYKAHTGFLCLHLALAWPTETLQLSPVYAIRGVIRPAHIVPLCHCLYSPSVVEVVKEYKWIAWLCEIFECLPDSVDHGWVAKWSGQKSLVHTAAVPIMSGWVHECFLD